VQSFEDFPRLCLGALIRNGMGNLAYVFSIPCVLLLWFSWLWFSIWNFMRRFDEAFVPKTNMYLSLFRCEVWNITKTILKNKLLFIHIWDFCEMWHSVVWKLWFKLWNFYVGENGVLQYGSWVTRLMVEPPSQCLNRMTEPD